ncbi:hypothetical protein Mal4_23250 [Maioricimonas rarisocia]|uniref:Uncharacterized protein n=1 Tax=Maioricimonas rarisocia TaxID=2528026 RepID=A0A517Z6B5_9PLAN|nr:hypothetical protein [Maioricimonas rarisocia]QDU38005.1 hypothetical protein Mal4_23250 [Maioricimonas rarisocia]
MLWHHRTKIGLALLYLVLGTAVYFGYRGPAGDRTFLLGCLVVSGFLLGAAALVVPVERCPECDDDLGYFRGRGPLRNMQRRKPRYKTCRQCGHVVDRWE